MMETVVGFLAVIALILANGWFVLGEFAFVAARRPQLEEQARAGDRRARSALAILSRLSFMLSGAQLGITVTSLLVGFIAEPVFSRAIAPLVGLLGLPETSTTAVALTAGLLLSTSAQMIFGELAPKNLGIALPETFSRALARGMRAYLVIAGPLIWFFDTAANALLRAVGIDPVEELQGGVSPQELERIIAESGRGGVLTSAQAGLLGRLLEFRTLRAADAMVPRRQVVSIPLHASWEDLRRAAVSSGHSRFPVTAEDDLDHVAGVVQVKDIFRFPVGQRADHTVADLTTDALIVPESAQLGPLLTDMRRARTTMAVVVDEYGGTAGVVTLEDIVEEIVGQIRDEYDPEEPAVQALPSGAFLVPGSWRPDEVNRATGLELPTGDYETMSGLVMERLGRVPATGDTVELEGVLVRVAAMDGLAVGRLRLVPVDRASRDRGDGT
jgi:CBS domain containing-hemolysin-like protein